MASIIYDSRLNAFLEDLIREANQEIVLFCPYFKLHDRLKDCLKSRIEDYNLQILMVFGKNEDNRLKA